MLGHGLTAKYSFLSHRCLFLGFKKSHVQDITRPVLNSGAFVLHDCADITTVTWNLSRCRICELQGHILLNALYVFYTSSHGFVSPTGSTVLALRWSLCLKTCPTPRGPSSASRPVISGQSWCMLLFAGGIRCVRVCVLGRWDGVGGCVCVCGVCVKQWSEC